MPLTSLDHSKELTWFCALCHDLGVSAEVIKGRDQRQAEASHGFCLLRCFLKPENELCTCEASDSSVRKLWYVTHVHLGGGGITPSPGFWWMDAGNDETLGTPLCTSILRLYTGHGYDPIISIQFNSISESFDSDSTHDSGSFHKFHSNRVKTHKTFWKFDSNS